MTGVYTVPDFGPSDLLSSAKEGDRRVKVSDEPSLLAATRAGNTYTISGTLSVPAGSYLAINQQFLSEVIVHSVSTNAGVYIAVYSDRSTGTHAGILHATNINLTSQNITPAFGELLSGASPYGGVVAASNGAIYVQIIADLNSSISIAAKNTTASSQEITITMTFEEIGPRSPLPNLFAGGVLQHNGILQDTTILGIP